MTESKRGRKPNPAAEPVAVELNRSALAEAGQAADQLSALRNEQRLLMDLYRKAGRIDGLAFVASVSERAIAEVYLDLKATFGDTGRLEHPMPDGSWKRASDFDEFCRMVLGVGDRRCRQIAAAIDMVGAELYDQARALGLGERQFREIRALPNDSQELVKKAIASNDKESVIEIIEELAARNTAMAAREAETQKTLAAKDRVIADKDEKLNKLAEAEHIRQHGTRDEREVAQIDELRAAGGEADAALMRLVATVDRITREAATESSELQARQTLDYVAQRLADLCATAGLHVDLLGQRVDPAWLAQIKQAAQAGAEEAPTRARRR